MFGIAVQFFHPESNLIKQVNKADEINISVLFSTKQSNNKPSAENNCLQTHAKTFTPVSWYENAFYTSHVRFYFQVWC